MFAWVDNPGVLDASPEVLRCRKTHPHSSLNVPFREPKWRVTGHSSMEEG